MKKIYLTALTIFVLSLSVSVYALSADGNFGTSPISGSNLSAGTSLPGNNASIQIQQPTLNTMQGLSNTGSVSSGSVSSGSGPCKIPTDIGTLFDYALCILDSAVVPFLIGLALILFLAGVVKFVSSGDNEEARQSGRNMMLFGIIALFVMVSIWGFVNILSRSFFGTDSTIQSLPRKSTTLFQQ